ncbi:baseplate J/gp47 family protein [Marinibacterium sp. SX1]|uniref:baseplate J/gp47 family protein n=1 Tax=Marinibacterium sp. SX1 TaxID=3388424 RepID=UPI003D186571
MSEFGVTPDGFVLKSFVEIMDARLDLLREMFGDGVDVGPASPLRKLAEAAAYEDQDLWKAAEFQYYAGFMSTGSADALDLIGEEVGRSRRYLQATGAVAFTLQGAEPARSYRLPLGLLLSGANAQGPVVLRTLQGVTLSEDSDSATVPVVCLERGPERNLAAGEVTAVHPDYLPRLSFGAASVTVANDAPVTGGELREDDSVYRARLIGLPRTVWTLDAVQAAARDVDGVRDVRLTDTNGGIDLTLGYFGDFEFATRPFAEPRPLGSPYFFDVLVAIEPGLDFDDVGSVEGIRSRVRQAIDPIRPVSIYPNIERASHVRIGARADILVRSGADPRQILAAIEDRLALRINALGLGRTVRFADVMVDMRSVPGVVDVQNLRLRKRPGQFGRVQFGARRELAGDDVEVAIGANIALEPDEIAEFAIASDLLDVRLEAV